MKTENFILTPKVSRILWIICVVFIYMASLFGRTIETNYPDLIPTIPYLGALLFSSFAFYIYKLGQLKIAMTMLALLALGALAMEPFIGFPVERVHYIKYSLLGIFSFFSVRNKSTLVTLLVATFAACLIGIVEEASQLGIPRRFFDWRDIGINLASALIGVLVALTVRSKFNKQSSNKVQAT